MMAKLTPARQKKITDLLRAGNSRECASRSAGISKSTFYLWMTKGRDSKRGAYSDFVDAIEKAEQEAEAFHVANIARAASNGTWQASAWWLERVKHERYGRRQAMTHSKTPTKLTAEETAALAETAVVNAGDGSIVWKRQLLLLEKAYQAGEIDSKFYFQMMTQLTAGATRLAELQLRGDGPSLPNVQIEFHMSDEAIGRPKDQPITIATTERCGDLIEVA